MSENKKTRKNNVVIENRKARHDYYIEETLECGVELRGHEVKSIRAGMASIKEAWIHCDGKQMFIRQMHITPWETANRFDTDVKREVRLLAHSREIAKLFKQTKIDGYTLVPLKVYFNDRGKCKVLVGICKGKKDYDKRASDKAKEARKEMRQH